MATPTPGIIDANATNARGVADHGIESRWVPARLVTGLSTADNSGTVTDPDTHMAAVLCVRLNSQGKAGTHLLARVKHQCTTAGSVTIQAWGSSDPTGPWMILPTKDGSTTLTIATTTLALATITSGGYAYTDASDLNKAFDRMGCTYVMIAVLTALAATNHASASLEVKAL